MKLQDPVLYIRQVREFVELIGFETRNKYEISDSTSQIGFAAEQNKGIWGFIGRQFFGHWRTFEVAVFNNQKEIVLRCHHPFRFLFQRFEVESAEGRPLGFLQQRFAFFRKRFDLHFYDSQEVMEMNSPFWKFWTFPVFSRNQEVALIEKRWSGTFDEIFMDSDKFRIVFKSPSLTNEQKLVILAAALFTDLQYFERKAR